VVEKREDFLSGTDPYPPPPSLFQLEDKAEEEVVVVDTILCCLCWCIIRMSFTLAETIV